MCRLSHISGHFRLNLSDHERVNQSSFSPHAFMRFSGVSAFQRSHCKDTTRLSGSNRTLQNVEKKLFLICLFSLIIRWLQNNYLLIIVLFMVTKQKERSIELCQSNALILQSNPNRILIELPDVVDHPIVQKTRFGLAHIVRKSRGLLLQFLRVGVVRRKDFLGDTQVARGISRFKDTRIHQTGHHEAHHQL